MPMTLAKALSLVNQQISLVPRRPGEIEAMMLITNIQVELPVSNHW